jgi:type 1 glutamine amidotransferase
MKPLSILAFLLAAGPALAAEPIVLQGQDGVGKGKHVVLVSGDQEYRSEEAIPALAKILAERHGFKCTVLFTVDKDGNIEPNGPKVNGVEMHDIPGLDALKSADLLIIFSRFLNLPDDQMQQFEDYLKTGKPVVGLRTSTHAFNIPGNAKFGKFGNGSGVKGWEGGFGKVVLGEQWVAHHGNHGKEGTRGIAAPGADQSPILKGIAPGEIFGTTDVYTAKPPKDATILLLGEVTETLDPKSKPVAGKKNDPMMPVAWTKPYTIPGGKEGRAFCTTMGASQDLQFEGTRRLIVNGSLWTLGLEIPEKTNVELVGEYKPTPFKFGGHKKGVKPADLFK